MRLGWIDILKIHAMENYPNLPSLVKIVMMLSHGNVALKRGFLINKECLAANQSKRSFIVQRLIYDSILTTNKPVKQFDITKKLWQYIRNSYA